MFIPKRALLLFAAELIGVVILRLVYMIKRDSALPKGSKVGWIKGKPVIRNFFQPKRRALPHQSFSVGGWTPPPPTGKIAPTPDTPPDA